MINGTDLHAIVASMHPIALEACLDGREEVLLGWELESVVKILTCCWLLNDCPQAVGERSDRLGGVAKFCSVVSFMLSTTN